MGTGLRPVQVERSSTVREHWLCFLFSMWATPTRCSESSRKLESDGAPESQHYERLVANWRVATIATQTVDEYGVLFRNLFAMDKIEVKGIHGIIISSVVPPVDSTLRQVCEHYFNTRPLFIEPGIKTGMPVLYENPAEVGADRIVNSVAAFEKFGGPCVVVDFGTATTFDCVSAKGEYQGGVICPGIGISADALFENTARLPRVDIRKPARVIGSTTVGSLQSGLYYGYLGLVDGILERLLDEMEKKSLWWRRVDWRDSSAPGQNTSSTSTTCLPWMACASSGSGTQRPRPIATPLR